MKYLLVILALSLSAGCSGPVQVSPNEVHEGEAPDDASAVEQVERWKQATHSESCVTQQGITVNAEKSDLAIDIELLFPDGYNVSGARVDVDSTHWKFAPNSGGSKSPAHYVFALQPNGTSWDADEGIEFDPRSLSDKVYVTVYHIKRISANDAYLDFELQMNERGFEITNCTELD